MKSKILVFGSEGFIGSHLVEELIKSGYKVKAFVLYNYSNSNGWLDNIKKNIFKDIEICHGDIRDYGSVVNALKGCKSVINLAALIGIPYSYIAASSYVETNINGTLNILNACMKLSINKIIMTSTSEVYGSGKYFPMDENHPLNAQSPYAATKIGSDQLSLSFYKSFGMPISIIRPFNTYGPRQSARAVIPTIISQVFRFNKVIKLGNIHTKRDFTYVTDTVLGFVKALESDKSIGEVINLGTGTNFSIKDTIKIVSNIIGKNIKVKKENARLRPNLSEVDNLLSSNKKAKKLLNWKPKFNGKKGFETGIKHTIDWFSNEKNLQHYSSDTFVY